MVKTYYFGFNFFVASTVMFIVAILTPYWIIKTSYRGIFEICPNVSKNSLFEFRRCGYLLPYTDNSEIMAFRQGMYIFFCLSRVVNLLNFLQSW